MTWISSSTRARPQGLSLGVMLCLIAGVALRSASASAQDKDTTITGAFFDQVGITTGVAPLREVLQFNIVDSGAGDGLPTLVRGIRFHADVAEGAIFLGTDFAWRLRVPADNPGQFIELDAAAAPANASFNVTFLSSSAFLKIPDGESATIELLLQFTGGANGQLPGIPTASSSNGVFLTADVAEGDFLTEDDGSSLFGEAASPTLSGHVRVDRPNFRWVLPPDEPGEAGELVEGIAEVVDDDGNRLTAITDNHPAFVDFYASGIPFKVVAETDGPFGGLYYFTSDAPVAGGGTTDARLNLDNSDGYPLGTLKLRAGVSARVDLEIVNFTIWGDSDSYFEQVSSLFDVELGEGFGSVWFVRLIDTGATDHVPTVVYEITFDVIIGDGCVFDALDASWRLNVSGDTFEPVDVTADTVKFRTTVHLGMLGKPRPCRLCTPATCPNSIRCSSHPTEEAKSSSYR